MKTDLLDIRHQDCMELMAEYPDKHFDLAIVDPPYGIGIVSQFQKTTESKRSMMRGVNGITGSEWDSETPDAQYFVELCREIAGDLRDMCIERGELIQQLEEKIDCLF